MPGSPSTSIAAPATESNKVSSCASSRSRPNRSARSCDVSGTGRSACSPASRIAVCSASVSAVGLTPSSFDNNSRVAAYRASADAGRPASACARIKRRKRVLVVGVVGQGLLGVRRRFERLPAAEQRFGTDEAHTRQQPLESSALEIDPLTVLVRQQRTAHQLQRRERRRARAGEATGAEPGRRVVGPSVELDDVQPIGVQRVPRVAVAQPIAAEHGAQPAHEHRNLIGRAGRRGLRATARRSTRRSTRARRGPAPTP